MGIKEGTKHGKNTINIWPLAIWYIIVVLIIGGGFVLLMIIGPILIVIFENQSLDIFGYSIDNSWILVVTIPIALMLNYMFFKAVFWKVSFTETHLIVPKISEVQEKNIKIECNQILTCETSMEGFYYFFAFRCEDGKKRKMFIARFSFKQLKRILKLIKERGGLQDQDIDDIIDPLRIRKKKKSIKRN